MLIPKDSTIFIAQWALNHSEKYAKDPDIFDTERFAGFSEPANHYIHSPANERDHYSYGPYSPCPSNGIRY